MTHDGSCPTLKTLRGRLRYLYEADRPTAHRFRYALLVFDLATILFIVASSFLERSPPLEAIDVLFGLVILADFTGRLLISRTTPARFGYLLTSSKRRHRPSRLAPYERPSKMSTPGSENVGRLGHAKGTRRLKVKDRQLPPLPVRRAGKRLVGNLQYQPRR